MVEAHPEPQWAAGAVAVASAVALRRAVPCARQALAHTRPSLRHVPRDPSAVGCVICLDEPVARPRPHRATPGRSARPVTRPENMRDHAHEGMCHTSHPSTDRPAAPGPACARVQGSCRNDGTAPPRPDRSARPPLAVATSTDRRRAPQGRMVTLTRPLSPAALVPMASFCRRRAPMPPGERAADAVSRGDPAHGRPCKGACRAHGTRGGKAPDDHRPGGRDHRLPARVGAHLECGRPHGHDPGP